jgi:cholesterol transport system auxiliary component
MRRRIGGHAAVALAMVGVAACSLRPAPRAPVALYDLEAAPAPAPGAPPSLDKVIVVYDPTAPNWLVGRQMRYRLAYDDPGRIRRYANSQWASSPITAVGDSLRASLSARTKRSSAVPDYGQLADFWVRVHVERLEQIFDSRVASHGIVRLRVAVFRGRDRAFVGQQTFEGEAGAPTPDAGGGVTAASQAISNAVEAAASWIVDLVRSDVKGPGLAGGGQ